MTESIFPLDTGGVTDGGAARQGLAAIDAEHVPARSLPASPASPAQTRAAGWTLSDLWLPAMVLHERALVHNLDRFAGWCAENGVELAPHGKTTMSPHIWSAQLARGAWGLTAATTAQARVMRAAGVPRVLIANEVVDPQQIAWLAESLADRAFEPLCLVDSADGVRLLDQHLAAAPQPLPVLVELGVEGKRTGVRELPDALALAERVAATSRLRLAGIEGYEGVLPQRRDTTALQEARVWLDRLVRLAEDADSRGLFSDSDEVIVTAGGSAFPDLAAEAMGSLPRLSRPIRRLVRSGCYVTHDDRSYERSSPLRSTAAGDPLLPALSCFARVLSCPEPGRALLGVGKRDVPFDIDLPVPRAVRRGGERLPLAGGAEIVKLNDHHGFCDTESGLLEIGDVVELGLSHPCTAFDKWPLIPVLDDRDRVVDAVRTVF